MKRFYLVFTLCCFYYSCVLSKNPEPILPWEETVESCLASLNEEVTVTLLQYQPKIAHLNVRTSAVKQQLLRSVTTKEKLFWLLEKDKLRDELTSTQLKLETNISKIRYIKGLQIIKILYEKTLALDHHFASVASLQEINKIANPNHYPEFEQIKARMEDQGHRKKGFDLTQILGNNIYTSVAHSLISLFTNENASKTEKENSLKEMECILDFTLRMHNDLNTIYFETVFLQKSNENVMGELTQLFTDYTKPIRYKKTLSDCRNTDDWAAIRDQLNQYLAHLDDILLDDSKQQKAHTMQINLEFPIDRLLQFITLYNAFIDQGAKFYEKFGIMLNSYENEEQCRSKIPIEYSKLKESVSIAIEKFNTAYKPVEINGSKMKEVLYGINEYD